jgi:hypothetical protein
MENYRHHCYEFTFNSITGKCSRCGYQVTTPKKHTDQERVKELEKALEFYAYEENWEESLFGPWTEIHAHLDKGEIARAVLVPPSTTDSPQ